MKKIFVVGLILTALITPPLVQANHENCLTAGFWIEESLYNYYKPEINPKSSNTFEQWAQRHMDAWNEILRKSGVKDCFKIGKIKVVPDRALPLSGNLTPTNYPDFKDRSTDVVWGFPAEALTNSAESRRFIDDHLNSIDWGLLHELSHARYLDDEYLLNIHSKRDQIEVRDPQGDLVTDKYFKPIWGDLIYENKSKDFMAYHANPASRFYAPHSAMALNLIAGAHTAGKYGNYNAPDNLGVYLDDLPKENLLKILSKESQLLAGAQVKIFQSVRSTKGIYDKKIDNNPDLTSVADNKGVVSIGHNPFGGTRIDSLAGNTVFMVEVSYFRQLFYKFIEVSDFNLAYWQGATETATFTIQTDISALKTIPSDPLVEEIARDCRSDDQEAESSCFKTVKECLSAEAETNNSNYLSCFALYRRTNPIDCRRFNNNLQACNKIRGCAYYSCSQQCLPTDTPMEQTCPAATAAPAPAIPLQSPSESPAASNTPRMTQLIISNNPIFDSASEGTLVINNPLEKQEITWKLKPQDPVYIQEINSDNLVKQYQLAHSELKDGQMMEIGNIVITFLKVITVKKVVEVTIGDQRFNASNLDDIARLKEGVDPNLNCTNTDCNLPLIIKYSDGDADYLAFEFDLPAPAIQTPANPEESFPPQTPEEPENNTQQAEDDNCVWNKNPYGECDWDKKQVYDFEINSCTNEVKRYNYHFVDGQCGYNGSSNQTSSNTIITCKGETKTWSQLDAELRLANFPGPFDHTQQELDAYNRATCP